MAAARIAAAIAGVIAAAAYVVAAGMSVPTLRTWLMIAVVAGAASNADCLRRPTVDDWKRAFATHDLAPLMTTVVWFEIVAP